MLIEVGLDRMVLSGLDSPGVELHNAQQGHNDEQKGNPEREPAAKERPERGSEGHSDATC